MKSRKCVLQSSSGSYPSVTINANEKKFIGRSPETRIEALHCSKKQLTVKISEGDGKDPILMINKLGSNPSFMNGKQLGLYSEAKEGDKIELVPDLGFHYTVTFPGEASNESPSPTVEISPKNSIKRKASPELEAQKAVKDPPKKQKTDVPSWQEVDGGKLLIYTAPGVTSLPKIAAYDLDWTIIKTKSGNVFPKNIDDWQIAFSEVPGKLKKLSQDGYKVVFFTNQGGISSGKLKPADLRTKLERIVGKLGVPVQVLASTGKGKYRKPVPGMWEYLLSSLNDNVLVDLKASFYCGDAAGRPEVKKPVKKKKDFSSSDRLFALNIGIDFHTPEEHFLGKPSESWTRPEFDPTNLPRLSLTDPEDAQMERKDGQEVVVMVGSPASGKSRFARTTFESYEYINRDTFGSWQKCVAMLEKAVSAGKSAVIDNTNPDPESRKRYVEVARKRKVQCRCFLMLTGEKQAKHNNVFREITDSSHAVLGDMVFGAYRGKFKEPTLKEGFGEIVRVNFVPEFDDPEMERLYKMFLLDK